MGNAQTSLADEAVSSGRHEPIINNFSIQVAAVNGSGSQSANLVLMRTIFQMGYL